MTPVSRRACKALLCASVTVAILIARPALAHAQTVVDSCMDITQPGLYVLGGNLVTPPGQPCMQVHSQGPVTLDCQNYAIETAYPGLEAVHIENSQNFAIQNCTISVTAQFGGTEFEVINSSNGLLQNNTFYPSPIATDGNAVAVVSSDSMTISGNHFFLPYSQTRTTNSNVVSNSFSCAIGTCANLIYSAHGGGNVLSYNTIDGLTTTDQTTTSTGADDGINIWDETSDTANWNTISNTFDCGIEFYGNIYNGTFNNNTMTNTAFCGIGGWFYMTFYGNLVRGNVVNGATSLFTFSRYYGLRPNNWDGRGAPAETGIYFAENTFDGNSITNLYTTALSPLTNAVSTYIPFDIADTEYLAFDPSDPNNFLAGETAPTASQFHLTGNTFSNNNFGTSKAAYFGEPAYPGAVIDKGNNVCAQQYYADYPLACGVPPCGTEGNPWNIGSYLVTSTAHANEWGQRTANGTCELGSFSYPVTRAGVTTYFWIQKKGYLCVPASTCPRPS